MKDSEGGACHTLHLSLGTQRPKDSSSWEKPLAGFADTQSQSYMISRVQRNAWEAREKVKIPTVAKTVICESLTVQYNADPRNTDPRKSELVWNECQGKPRAIRGVNSRERL